MSHGPGMSDDKGDKVNSGALHRSPSINLTAEENSGKHTLGDRLMTVRAVIASNEVTLSSNDVSRIAQYVREAA